MKKYILLLLGLLLLSGCSTSESETTYTYAGPGSEYSIDLKGDLTGTFEIKESVQDLTVEGTFETLETGFKKLVIGSTTHEDVITKNAVRYGVDIPDVLFIMQPLKSAEKKALVSVATGNCPSTDFSANFILTNIANGDDAKTVFTNGVVSYDVSENTATVDNVYNIQGSSAGLSKPTISLTGACSEGTQGFSADGNIGKIYYTQSGVAVLKFNNGEILFALPKHEDLSEKKDMDDDYHGLVLVGDDVAPFTFNIKEETAESKFNRLSSDALTVLTGNMNEGTSNITELGIGTGLHRGSYTMTSDDAPGGKAGANMSCMSGKVSSRGYFVCVGSDAGDLVAPFDLLNVLMVTK